MRHVQFRCTKMHDISNYTHIHSKYIVFVEDEILRHRPKII